MDVTTVLRKKMVSLSCGNVENHSRLTCMFMPNKSHRIALYRVERHVITSMRRIAIPLGLFC